MHFASLFVLATAAISSVSAIAIPKHNGQHEERAADHALASLEARFDEAIAAYLERRAPSFFRQPGDPSSSSGSGSGSNSSPSSGSRTGSPNNSEGSSLGLNRLPSPESRPSSNQQQAKITFGDKAREHLDELGLHGKDRKKVKKEHVSRIKQEMKVNGATHATVERLAHKAGSVDPNVHITATFQKAQAAANGGLHKEPIKSEWTDHATGEKVTGNNHHVYTNMADKTKGEEAMPKHHPTYDATLKKKPGSGGVAKYRRSMQSVHAHHDY